MESISIVLCTFNGAKYLDAQLRSLCAQAGVVEIFAIDDGSTDNTIAILRQHARRDPRIKVSRNRTRFGVARNFERAIHFARAPWIALADQDDVWLPHKLERMRAQWDGRACLLHHASLKFRGEVPATIPPVAGERRKFSGGDVRYLLYRNTVVGHATLIRADVARAITPFPKNVAHDWWLGLGAALHGTVQYIDEYLVCYRIHETNAYHRRGSRRLRLRQEHELRLIALDALLARRELTAAARVFVQDYRARLMGAAVRRWPLGKFYLRHAAVLFGCERVRPGAFTCVRKSLAAMLDAARHTTALAELAPAMGMTGATPMALAEADTAA
jgi:glycosyltransferase involved in cell wall biosynthesis